MVSGEILFLNRTCYILLFLSVKEWLKNVTVSSWSGNPIFSTASTDLCFCTTLTCALHSTSLPCFLQSSIAASLWIISLPHQCGAGNRALANSPSVTRCFERSPCPSCLPSFQVVEPYLQAMEEKPFSLHVMQRQMDNKTLKSSSPAWLPNYSPHSVACQSLSCDIFPFPWSYALDPLLMLVLCCLQF